MAGVGDARGVLTLGSINASTRIGFVSMLGDLFEHSPWVAERAWDARPFADREALFDALSFVMMSAGNSSKLALIRAHPQLAGRASRAEGLTRFSNAEQAGAGLDSCTEDEVERLQSLNAAYLEKFGFPCVIAVKGLDKRRILQILAERLGSTKDAEFAENLRQIMKIAKFRLEQRVAAA